MLKSFIQENRPLFIFHVILFLASSYPLFVYNKISLFIQLNAYHHPFLDHLFYYMTFLGSTVAHLVLIASLFATKKDPTMLLVGLSSFVVVSLLVQGIKSLELFEQSRPITLMSSSGVPLHLVEGVIHRIHWSFPSGHAATIFSTVWLIYLHPFTKSWWFSAILCCIACLVAYSRVYLCQHFYRDIYIGALIGTLATIFIYNLLNDWPIPDWLRQILDRLLPLQNK